MSDGVWTQRAFSPAHLTGFFEVRTEHDNPYRKGSRGAGLNLELGVTAQVTIRGGGSGVSVSIDGQPDPAPVVKTAVQGLIGYDYPAGIEISLTSGLPVSQGFGLSGAGALASGFALAGLIGFPPKKAAWEAHRAEVIHRTGLGDVAGQFMGGAEIRITPGPMPMGVTERFAGLEARRSLIVCCVLEEHISTAAVLSDADRVARINAAGADCVEKLRADPTLRRYVQLSRAFAEQVGLISPPLADALSTADRYGWATQTMLGNALHLVIDPKSPESGDPKAAMDALSAHGRVWMTRISARGAHLLE